MNRLISACRLATIGSLALILASCGAPEPSLSSASSTSASAPTPTFAITADDFVSQFNDEAKQNSATLLSCNKKPDGTLTCKDPPTDMNKRLAAAKGLGVEVPGMKEYRGEHIELTSIDGKLSQVMISGDRRVYGAIEMAGLLQSFARFLGKDVANAEFATDSGTLTFMDAAGLAQEPPPFGTQVQFSRPYAEFACALATEEPLIYECHISPPGNPVQIIKH